MNSLFTYFTTYCHITLILWRWHCDSSLCHTSESPFCPMSTATTNTITLRCLTTQRRRHYNHTTIYMQEKAWHEWKVREKAEEEDDEQGRDDGRRLEMRRVSSQVCFIIIIIILTLLFFYYRLQLHMQTESQNYDDIFKLTRFLHKKLAFQCFHAIYPISRYM